MRRSRREPTEDELALWRHVTRDVTTLSGRARPIAHPAPVEDIAPAPEPAPTPPAPRSAVIDTQAPLTLGATAGLDRRNAQRFARGQMGIEARLDLHGLTLREAHDAVAGFIRSSVSLGRRCVLIITGKGATSDTGRLRREAPHWLSHPSLRPAILAVREARPQHGGGGALYVLLKRQRSF